MDEVSKIKKDLEKTMPNNDANTALELLRSLDSIPMTLDVLQKTHIGMAVNKIRKSIDNPEVSSLSKSMVKKWKKLLSSNNPSANNNANIPANNGNNTNSNISIEDSNSNHMSSAAHSNQDRTPQPVNSPSAAANNVEKVKRPHPVQTEVPHTTSEYRLKCRELLTNALKKPLPKNLARDEHFLEEEALAARIEDCIFQEFKNTQTKYANRVRSRVSNLGDVKNPYLKLNVLRGDLTPDRIAKMTAEEMASDELKKERQKFTQEAINDHQLSVTGGTTTSDIKCPACKKFNVTYNQVQTRSADEPMTTFCLCNECGRRWKFC